MDWMTKMLIIIVLILLVAMIAASIRLKKLIDLARQDLITDDDPDIMEQCDEENSKQTETFVDESL